MHDPAAPDRVARLRRRTSSRTHVYLFVMLALLLLAALGFSTSAAAEGTLAILAACGA